MKNLLVLALSMFTLTLTIAQKSFVEGKILLPNGEVEKGLIHQGKLTNFSGKNKKEAAKVLMVPNVLAGASYNTMYFYGEPDELLVLTDFTNHLGGLVGIGVDFILPFNNRSWSIQNEVCFGDYETYANYDKEVTETLRYYYSMNFGFTYLGINNLLRYRFRIDPFTLYLSIGISNNFMFFNKNKMQVTRMRYDDDTVEEHEMVMNPKGFEQALNFGLGINVNKVGVEFRYQRGTGVSPYSHIGNRTNRYQMLLGFRF